MNVSLLELKIDLEEITEVESSDSPIKYFVPRLRGMAYQLGALLALLTLNSLCYHPSKPSYFCRNNFLDKTSLNSVFLY